MFTGLIEEVGAISDIVRHEDSIRIEITAPKVTEDAHRGDSIAVNGVCLTVVELRDDTFSADVMQESLSRSALGALDLGSSVNLERAMLPTTRLGGHMVQGHVDDTAQLLSRTPSEHWEVFRFSLPQGLAKYVVEKGSIALNGTSLTVSSIGANWFEVSLIPVTLAETVLGTMEVGSRVNIEVDVLAKYVERMLDPQLNGKDITG
ncbi:MAG: riboflavin synthase [Corynebacterium sp.]|nr:riboflavin synthase [Corynebacterium sp.]